MALYCILYVYVQNENYACKSQYIKNIIICTRCVRNKDNNNNNN